MPDKSNSNPGDLPEPQTGELAMEWIARLREDQLRRWQQGTPLPVTVYLKAFPQLETYPEGLLDLITHEVLLRREAGETPQAADYTQAFPTLAVELQQQLDLDACLMDFQFDADTVSLDTPLPASPADASVKPLPDTPPGAPPVPPRFRIVRRLGAGAFGEVWLARDLEMKRAIALKFLKLDPGRPTLLTRFRREAEIAATLNHPNLCTLHEQFWDNDPPFLVLEYVDGRTLGEEMAVRQPFPLDRAVDILLAAAGGALHAHERGIVHRDLKPDNIKIRTDGIVKVLDFGLARPYVAARDLLTSDGRLVGTLPYMAPEQLRGQAEDIRPAVDQYALGVILYQLIAGRHPFLVEGDANPGGLMIRIEEGRFLPPCQLRADVDEALNSIVLRMMARSPRHRFPSLQEALIALKAYQQGSRAPVVVPGPTPWKKRAAIGAVLILSMGLFAFLQRGKPEPHSNPQEVPPVPPTVTPTLAQAPEGLVELLDLIRRDLDTIDVDDQPFQRYFSQGHLRSHPSVDSQVLRRHRDALTELLQSLHFAGPIVPTAVDGEGTVFRLDLRKASWVARTHWEELQRGNPYALQFPSDNTMRPLRNVATEVSRKIGEAADRPRPAFLRVDWLLVTFTQPERARGLLSLSSATEEEIADRLRQIAALRQRTAEVRELYGRPLDLADVGRELGWSDGEAVRQAILASPCLADELGLRPLTEGKRIDRGVWAHSDVVFTTFGELAMQLRLGRRLLVP